jgi:hypothetical protein
LAKYTNISLRKSRLTRIIIVAGITGIILALSLFILLFLMTTMPGTSVTGPLPALTAEQTAVGNQLRTHVEMLANTIGPRHELEREGLEQTADYILEEFRSYGYNPEVSTYGEAGFRNINVTLSGTTDTNGILIIGAHYDSARSGTPGADDNASGVAVMLEMARALYGEELKHSLRFVSFPNEERPYFNTPMMGSQVTARLSAEAGEDIIGMFSLEMLGYYSDEPGSQHYPPIIRNLYPDTGNFVAFVSNMSSRLFLQQVIGAFREQNTFPSQGMAAPEALVRDIRRSDNSAYWDHGYPAVMVTDTSNFRTPNYHTLADTPETLSYESMARLTEGLVGMVINLANSVK